MTQTTTKQSEGLRKALRIVREPSFGTGRRTDSDGRILVLEAEESYPGGVDNQTLLGFWFRGYDEVRVEVWYDRCTAAFRFRGFARTMHDWHVPEELTADTPGLSVEFINDINAFLRNPNRHAQVKAWPKRGVETYSLMKYEFPADFKKRLMRALGLTR